MTEKEAQRLMDEYGLSDGARATLAPLIGTAISAPAPEPVRKPAPSVRTVPSPTSASPWRPADPDRPLWFAAAWLCGASHSILALLAGGISEQAVQQSINKTMPNAVERHSHRMGYRLSRERVETLRNRYYSNVELLRGKSPVDAAKWLLQEEEDEG